MLAARERLRSLDSLLAAAGGASRRLLGEDARAGRPGAAATTVRAPPSWWRRRAPRWRRSTGVDPLLDPLAERLRALALETRELGYELAGYCEHAADGGRELAGGSSSWTPRSSKNGWPRVERLVRKHGGSIESVHEYARTARSRRDELSGARVSAGEVEQQLKGARGDLERHVRGPRSARRAAAGPFSEAVAAQLATLAMPRRDLRGRSCARASPPPTAPTRSSS